MNTNFVNNATTREMHAYLGLDLAMSFMHLGEFCDSWSQEPFIRQSYFTKVLSRNRFPNICVAVQLYIYGDVDQLVRLDLFWSLQSMFLRFLKREQQLAVLKFQNILDERSVRTKARTRAKSYCPSNPDKHAVRFYAFVNWKTTYIHNAFDNVTGISVLKSHIKRYIDVFSSIFAPFDRVYNLRKRYLPAKNAIVDHFCTANATEAVTDRSASAD